MCRRWSFLRRCSAKTVRFVDNNNDQAGKDATTFMLVKGYNHLVFAYTDMDELVQTERYQGYCEALQEYDKKGVHCNYHV